MHTETLRHAFVTEGFVVGGLNASSSGSGLNPVRSWSQSEPKTRPNDLCRLPGLLRSSVLIYLLLEQERRSDGRPMARVGAAQVFEGWEARGAMHILVSHQQTATHDDVSMG